MTPTRLHQARIICAQQSHTNPKHIWFLLLQPTIHTTKRRRRRRK